MGRELYRELGMRLGRRRDELRLSQQEVADRAGLTRSGVANIETGRQAVLLHDFLALARALEAAPAELLPPPPPAAPAAPRRTKVDLFVASLRAPRATRAAR